MQSTEDVDNLIGYLENKNKNQLDGIDRLFLSYAGTFKQFPPRRQAMLKIQLVTLLARAEISELDAQTTPALTSNKWPAFPLFQLVFSSSLRTSQSSALIDHAFP
jgi:hypothetical protein